MGRDGGGKNEEEERKIRGSTEKGMGAPRRDGCHNLSLSIRWQQKGQSLPQPQTRGHPAHVSHLSTPCTLQPQVTEGPLSPIRGTEPGFGSPRMGREAGGAVFALGGAGSIRPDPHARLFHTWCPGQQFPYLWGTRLGLPPPTLLSVPPLVSSLSLASCGLIAARQTHLGSKPASDTP